MQIERQAGALVIRAPAKVNLFLEVLAKRPDGYHDIETLMVAVNIFDTLKFREDSSGDIRLTCNRPELSTGPDNLVVRAAALLKRQTGCEKGARIRLVKRIPLAAGLAGGSSDAAVTLIGLNRLWKLQLSPKQLMSLATELGSDVAFFFSTPTAWCTGRGEQVRPLRLGKPLWFVLVCPPFGISTALVYRRLTPPDQPQSGAPILDAARVGGVEEIGRRLHNRLQPVALRFCPALVGVQDRLAVLGPAASALSGSGSSFFALCRDEREALRIARGLRNRAEQGMNLGVFIVRSCS